MLRGEGEIWALWPTHSRGIVETKENARSERHERDERELEKQRNFANLFPNVR